MKTGDLGLQGQIDLQTSKIFRAETSVFSECKKMDLSYYCLKDFCGLISELNKYTNSDGVFCPRADMAPLARRYRFCKTLSEGRSAVMVSAVVSFIILYNYTPAN